MSKSNVLETQVVGKLFNNTAIPWDANVALFVSLHSADPGEAGTQLTSEVAYTGYARVSVPRDNTGFTVSGNQAANTALVQLPQCTAGSATATYVAIGTASTGAGTLLYSGLLTAPLAISPGIQPQFSAGSLVATEE